MRNYTKKDILHVAESYRIPLTKKESEDFLRKFEGTLKYLESFKEKRKLLKKQNPLHHPAGLKNALREDRIQKSLKSSMVFANSKNKYKGYFTCPGLFNEK